LSFLCLSFLCLSFLCLSFLCLSFLCLSFLCLSLGCIHKSEVLSGVFIVFYRKIINYIILYIITTFMYITMCCVLGLPAKRRNAPPKCPGSTLGTHTPHTPHTHTYTHTHTHTYTYHTHTYTYHTHTYTYHTHTHTHTTIYHIKKTMIPEHICETQHKKHTT
jgi:hypothetical protein